MNRLILFLFAVLCISGLWAIDNPVRSVPDPAILISPVDMATRNSIYPTFFWEAPTSGPDPDYYYVCISETYPPTVSDEAGFVYTPGFTSTVPLNFDTTYYWTIIASNVDGNSTNNEIRSFTTIGDVYLMESFESGIIPPEWTVLNNDNGEYYWGVQSWTSYGGANSAGIIYESSTLQNDDWLITPALEVSDSTTDEISFWMGTFNPTFPEEWQVLISTTDTDPSSFTMIDSGATSTYGYYQKVYNLDSYGNAIIFFAFRYIGLNDDMVILDEFIGPRVYKPIPVVTITNSNNDVILNWDEIPTAMEYRVYSSDDNSSWDTEYVTVTAPEHSYTLVNPSARKKFFRVTAFTE